MERVEKELVGIADRRAHFTCALALCWPDGFQLSVEGHVHGTLVWPMRGQKGFGYDPMFLPDGSKLTFGEMAPEAKHAISHRAAAFRRLVDMAFG
jgi:XTP/dITP diphosphohydrolase